MNEPMSARTMRLIRRPFFRRSVAGYTATESMVVAGLIAVVGSFAAGNFRGQMPKQAVEGAAWQVTMDLRHARMQAISEDTRGRVSFDASNLNYTVWTDLNTNGAVDADEQTVKALDGAHNLALACNASTGVFLPRGTFASSSGFWEIRLAAPGVGARFVRVMPSGQVDWSNETL
jgi:Tfp pilus assembly protein FimT